MAHQLKGAEDGRNQEDENRETGAADPQDPEGVEAVVITTYSNRSMPRQSNRCKICRWYGNDCKKWWPSDEECYWL